MVEILSEKLTNLIRSFTKTTVKIQQVFLAVQIQYCLQCFATSVLQKSILRMYYKIL